VTSLIKTKDPAQYSALIEVIINKEIEIPDYINSEVLETCKTVAEEIESPNNIKLYEAAITLHSSYDSNELKTLSEKIFSLTIDGDAGTQASAFELLKKINEKLNMLGSQIGVKNSLESAREFFTTDISKVKPFLDYVFSYSEKLTWDQEDELVDLLNEQIDSEKSDQIRILSLDFITKLKESERKKTVGKVLKLAESENNPEIKKRCRKIILGLKEELTSSRLEKAKEIFGEDGFN